MIVSLTFRNAKKIEGVVLAGQVLTSEKGDQCMIILDIDDEMADVIRRTMLRMKAKNVSDENARELSDIADAA